MISNLKTLLNSLIKEIFSITFDLFKMMIPIIIIVKIIQELGGIEYIAIALEPIMQFVGLPSSLGLVWATTMISNIYGGMIIFITNPQESLTVAQVTILGSMMLMAHALPIEVRIAQKAGVRVLFTLILRIGSAVLLGFILHHVYDASDYLSETNTALWQPVISTDTSLSAWIISQLKTLFQVFLVISVLVVFLRILKSSGFERLLAYMLKPLLKILGLSDKTTSITIIGIGLGLTYGGGLLINEAKKGNISKLDIFGSLSLLAICHSLIEDTILIALLGADLTGILYARLLFSLILIAVIVRIVKSINEVNFTRYFVYPSNDS